MNKPKIIFSDIDGTLIHKNTEYNGELVQIPEEKTYISQKTVDCLHKLRSQGNRIAIITGRRKSGFARLAAVMPYDYAILEHGCVILDGDNFNKEWGKILNDTIGDLGQKKGLLWEYEQSLLNAGYKTDSEGRYASFRLFINKADDLSDDQRIILEKMVNEQVFSKGITTVININMLDVLPVKGGKENAIRYLVSNNHFDESDIVALGDDKNDINMMNYARVVLCPGNAKEDIIRIVSSKQGYVSPYSFHKGTDDLLEKLLGQEI